MQNREIMKSEAVKRMKALGIFPPTIRQFQDDGYISISEPPFGAFFWAEGDELNEIREFETEHNALVYLVVRCYTDIGQMDSYLYVSEDESDWEDDMEDIKNECAFTYTINREWPDCSEFGRIGFEKTIAAGLRRTW